MFHSTGDEKKIIEELRETKKIWKEFILEEREKIREAVNKNGDSVIVKDDPWRNETEWNGMSCMKKCEKNLNAKISRLSGRLKMQATPTVRGKRTQ